MRDSCIICKKKWPKKNDFFSFFGSIFRLNCVPNDTLQWNINYKEVSG